MIVFDVDGTLVGGEAFDWQCFEDAFEEAAGFRLTAEFFTDLEEVTAKAIVHQALPDAEHEERIEIETKTRQGFLSRLQILYQSNPSCFPPAEGAIELIHEIRQREIPLAIATGDWRESISLKLKAAGIPVEDIPMVTASEHYHRSDIIASAIQQANGSLENAIYIGDGVWDLKATQKLGIHFIGCGTRRERLHQAGAQHVLDSFHTNQFWDFINHLASLQ